MRANVDATVDRLTLLYAALGPRLGCRLVEANVLLLLADLRGSTNFVLFGPTNADRALFADPAMNNLLAAIGLRASIELETLNANGRLCSPIVLESLEGYHFVSIQTRLRGVASFEVWENLRAWKDQTHANLKKAYPAESDEVRSCRWMGLALGYPDQAIEDACACVAAGREWTATLTQVEVPAAARYGGAIPNFWHAPAHTDDPGILATVARWEQLLEGVYASPTHQHLAGDPTFQAARRAREGKK